MGKMRESNELETTTTTSLSKALLFTTMCIIGLPVEVHIKDGSIISGIFHTASVDQGYGIVLKKARMIKKGTHNSNVSDVGLIDTLVVLPGDLVQVVAKGVRLPPDDDSSGATYDDHGTTAAFLGSQKDAVLADEQWNQERQVGLTMHQGEKVDDRYPLEAFKEILKVSGPSTSVNDNYTQMSALEENHVMSNRSQSTDDCTDSVASDDTAAKESKLNPSAKNFSPSIPNHRSTDSTRPLVPTVPRGAHVRNSLPAVQLAGAQPERGAHVRNSLPAVQVAGAQPEIAFRSVVPRSYVPYVYPMAMNSDSGLPYNQPFLGHNLAGAQPIQIQALPPYVHPNSQNSMFGGPGQLAYIYPVTNVIQAPALMPQAQYPLMALHPIHGAGGDVLSVPPLPPSMNVPLMTNTPQELQQPTVPSHIHQHSQPPFTSMRPRNNRSALLKKNITPPMYFKSGRADAGNVEIFFVDSW